MRPESMSATRRRQTSPQAKPGRVQNGQQHAVTQRVDVAEKSHQLVDREHDGQIALAAEAASFNYGVKLTAGRCRSRG